MRCTRLCSADELSEINSDARSTTGADICSGNSLLGQTWFHQFRRTDWPDRDHANRVGGEEEMDQSVTISARAQLLHALAGSRGPAACYLCRLASAQDLWRYRRRRVFRYSIHLYPVGT